MGYGIGIQEETLTMRQPATPGLFNGGRFRHLISILDIKVIYGRCRKTKRVGNT
jgi:hypothetical protein